jgi:hypothetical protein
MTVKDLKKKLEEADDDSEVVLTFYMKEKGLYSVYLADVHSTIGYDAVTKEKLYNTKVCELSGFNHDDCTYVEKRDDK